MMNMTSNISKKAIQCLEEWLDTYLNFERTPKKGIFWLDTVNFLCNRFDNPEKSYKSVHIAGSKGKGSVSSMLSSIINEYVGGCGLYTSPHILSLEERITNTQTHFDEKIYEDALRELVYKVESIIPEQLPNEREITWFELITMYAFLCFRKANLSWAVFETGLGGRLDATNVLMPELSVIMPIELEHTEFLGDTIEKVAFEKAGIIKEKTPVCVSFQTEKALEVIREKAKETNSEIFYIGDYVSNIDFQLPKITESSSSKKMKVQLTFNKFFTRPIKANLSLIGKVQAENAAMASLCAKILFPEISEEIIEKGLENANISGRFEIIENPLNEDKKIVLDGAHTVNSIFGTLNSFKTVFSDLEKATEKNAYLLFGIAADKDIKHIAKEVIESQLFDKTFLTKPGAVKQSDLSLVEKAFEEMIGENVYNYEAKEDFSVEIKKAIQESAKDNKHLLITGSFYLVAEAKKELLAISSNISSESE